MKKNNEVVLYERQGKYIPRVAAVHDLCGYGKCSLGVAIPLLSAAGVDVCPLPTSLFSTHTLYPDFVMHDTTDFLPQVLDHWKGGAEMDLDGVYSGFLGSAEQVEIIQSIYKDYPQALRLVDPVMGDGGKRYPTYTEEMCEKMKDLVDGADLLLPNLTEAGILTGMDYPGQSPDEKQVRTILDALLEMGAKTVVLKGIQREGKMINYIQGRDTEVTAVREELLDFFIHGTGDLYASSLIASLYTGKDLESAVAFASKFVHDAMLNTRYQPNYLQRGVSFELNLGQVTDLLK